MSYPALGGVACCDCGHMPGTGFMCRRCKFVASGRPESQYEDYLRLWIKDFNRAGAAHGWKIVETP